MGAWFAFDCPACGYYAEVSGGPDCGLEVTTQTVHCLECCQLYEADSERNYLTPQAKPVKLRCPRKAAHQIRIWNHPGPCPRCTQPMVQGDPVAIWD